jgi:hypothetical protein
MSERMEVHIKNAVAISDKAGEMFSSDPKLPVAEIVRRIEEEEGTGAILLALREMVGAYNRQKKLIDALQKNPSK